MDVNAILSELSDYGFTSTSTTRKLSIIQAALRNVMYRKPWPFMQAVTTLTFDGVNANPVNTPTNLRAVMKVIDYTTGMPRRIRFKRMDDMEESAPLTDTGTPYYYYFEGSVLKLYQIPGATQTLRLRYVQTAPVISQSTTEAQLLLPPDYHEALVFRAVARLSDLDDDNDVAARFDGLYENMIVQMTEALDTQQFDEPEYVHVIDNDDQYDDGYWHYY